MADFLERRDFLKALACSAAAAGATLPIGLTVDGVERLVHSEIEWPPNVLAWLYRHMITPKHEGGLGFKPHEVDTDKLSNGEYMWEYRWRGAELAPKLKPETDYAGKHVSI